MTSSRLRPLLRGVRRPDPLACRTRGPASRGALACRTRAPASRGALALALACAATLVAGGARADEATAPAAPAASPAPPPAPRPAPYSLPWQLRPAGAASVVRSDTALAFHEDAAGHSGGATRASMLLVSYVVSPGLAALVRVGFVDHDAPTGRSGRGFVNPAFGLTYARPLTDTLRLALFLGVTAPIGRGGGNDAAAHVATAVRSGILARSAMDNAMFATNDLTVFPGVDLAWVHGGLTVQAEATVLQLTRVRGDEKQQDARKTNSTFGLHVGGFAAPWLSLGAELRYQRWLSTPDAVSKDSTLRDNATFAVGPRFHVRVSDGMWLRPGLAWARGLDAPMSKQAYDIVQLDLPLSF